MSLVVLKKRKPGERREYEDLQREDRGLVARARAEIVCRSAGELFREGVAQCPGLVPDYRVVQVHYDSLPLDLYNPLAEEHTYHVLSRFLNLDLDSAEEIARFYAEFGALSYSLLNATTVQQSQEMVASGPWSRHLAASRKKRPGWANFGGEPLWWLRREREELRVLVRVYDAWQQGHVEWLREIFGRVPKETPKHFELGREPIESLAPEALMQGRPEVLLDHPLNRHLATIEKMPYLRLPLCQDPASTDRPLRRLSGEECEAYARLLLARRINARLAKVRFEVAAPSDRGWARAAHQEKRLVPSRRFTTLLEALYLRMADLVWGGAPLLRCPECQIYFEQPRGWRGRPKIYCRKQCSLRRRMRDFHKRHPEGTA